ncbi:MAG: hypothetical protein IAF58_21395 [Leptolyngbya sp.]|nr:hypothetical protein [Candidatus Melainabacteria bacterium]
MLSLRKKLLFSIPVVVGMLFSFSSSDASAADAQPSSLVGGVEHKEKLAPVEKKFMTGSTWQNDTRDGANSTWIRIPEWLAGTWFTDVETATLRQDLIANRESAHTPFNFKVKSRFSYGSQMDGRGGIWHYLKLPYTSATDFPEFVEYHQVSKKDYTNQSEQLVSFRTMVAAARVERSSKEVVEGFQQESVTTYEPMEEGALKLKASTRRYDAQGKPVMQADNEGKIKRVEKFSPVAKDGNLDLQKSLADFLRFKKMEYLIPVELHAEPKKL